MTRFFRQLGLFLIVVIVCLSSTPLLAHGYIVRAIPDDRAVLKHVPSRLQYWFSEDLEPDFSSMHLRDQTGNIIASGEVAEEDPSLMRMRVPPDLPEGAYIVELRPAFASDGHVVAESRVFFIGEEVGGVSGAAASNQAEPLEVVWRAILLASTMLLFGVYALYSVVLLPAWGSTQHPAGLLPPRVMSRLNWIVTIGLIVAFAGSILALIQQTMVFFGVDALEVIRQGLWSVVRIGSRFGDVWNGRMLFLGIVALLHGTSLYLRKDYPETVRAFWTANVWLMALVIGASAVASHAAGSLLWPWLAMLVNWLHALGVAFWVGGILALVLVLPVALQPYQGENQQKALLPVIRRFSRLVGVAVLVVITTGIYNALNWLYTPGDLTQTTYGSALVLKGLLIGLLLLVGALHHLALHPAWAVRIERTTGFLGLTLRQHAIRAYYALMTWAGHFVSSLRLEVVFAMLVLVAVGLLSATPIPEPDFVNVVVETPNQTHTSGGLEVTMTISPGGPGVNTYDTRILRDGKPVDGLDVELQVVNPSRDWRSEWTAVEAVDSGLYVTVADTIDQPGQWWTLVNIRDGENDMTRMAFEWDIREEAAVIESRAPNIFNLLALVGVILALGWVIYPAAHRYYQKLDLSPVAVITAVGVTVIAIILLVVAFVMVEDTQRRYDETLYPPPEIINTVLPNAESLARGQALYLEHCIGWQTISDEFAILRDSGYRNRDDDLYAATVNGWRNLPACTGELNTDQRWDIVNYFRTLAKSR